MRVLRYLAIFSFVAGATMLAFGFFRSDSPGEAATYVPTPFDTVATVAPTSTTDNTPPGATATSTLEPSPTPPPYDGAVARLKIERFKVDSAIEEIGLLENNQLDVPHNPHNTGWYSIYDKPGHGGNAVFSAHVDYWPDIRGPFYDLKRLEAKDEIVITMDNGLEYRYEVVRKQRYTVDTIPMGELIWPADRPEGTEWITLITCGGDFVETQPNGSGEYLHRDVVVARRIE